MTTLARIKTSMLLFLPIPLPSGVPLLSKVAIEPRNSEVRRSIFIAGDVGDVVTHGACSPSEQIILTVNKTYLGAPLALHFGVEAPVRFGKLISDIAAVTPQKTKQSFEKVIHGGHGFGSSFMISAISVRASLNLP